MCYNKIYYFIFISFDKLNIIENSLRAFIIVCFKTLRILYSIYIYIYIPRYEYHNTYIVLYIYRN